ncbi:MAG: fused MFS/spermidine synthase [Acidobacteriota bacterium]
MASRSSSSSSDLSPERFALFLRVAMVVSGAAALLYETAWLRQLSLVMGHTVHALSAVLTAFLGGLALGAYISGRVMKGRLVNLKTYGWLEIGIGAAALLVAPGIAAISPLFGSAYRGLADNFLVYNLAQFAACSLVVMIPAVLMGATLPLVTALLSRHVRNLQSLSGQLYSANSLGGVLGVALGGFIFLPTLGVMGSTFLAVALNVGLGVAALVLARRLPEGEDETQEKKKGKSGRSSGSGGWPAPSGRWLAWIYGFSGFAALVLEVGWARIVSLSIGSTTYGFTIILSTYILGLALGSHFAPKIKLLSSDPVRGASLASAVVALWSLVSLSYLGTLPVRIVKAAGSGDISFGDLLLTETFLVGSTILLPTFAMGAMFPLMTGMLGRSGVDSSRSIGTCYAANTLGNILGSFVAGFFLVPMIGMRTTIVLAAVLSLLVALALAVPAILANTRRVRQAAAIAVGAMVLAGILAPGWDKEVVTSGPYLYASSIMRTARDSGQAGDDAIVEAMRDRFELIDYVEGATTVVTVKKAKRGGALHLQVGGKSDAFSFASTQNLIGHAPLLLHGDPKEVLILGLGSGSTLGSVLTHPVDKVDAVEISAGVKEMAAKHFAPYNNGALDDPRAEVRVGDGRNHLRHSGRTYDVIISQPSNPWISGAAGLFTLEYFQEVAEHLNPGGVTCSWFKLLADDGSATRSLLATVQQVFPECYLMETRAFGEYVVIAFKDREGLSPAAVRRVLSTPEAVTDLRRIRMETEAIFLSSLFLGPDEIRSLGEGAVINTDDNAFIEFMGPKLIRNSDKVRLHADLSQQRLDVLSRIDWADFDPSQKRILERQLTNHHEARGLALQARQLEAAGQEGSDEWKDLVRRGARLLPSEPYLASAIGRANQ